MQKKIFFSGVGGSGMSALAVLTARAGAEVWGSDRENDRHPDHPVFRSLREAGVRLVAQDGAGLDPSFERIVFTNAVEADHPERVRAEGLGVEILSRAELLAEMIAAHRTIAVAGTSGKSSTAGLLAHLMRELGMDPSFVGGGRVGQFRGMGNPGNLLAGQSGNLVAEACESDQGIDLYHPAVSVVLNLGLDHQSLPETLARFECLAGQTKDALIVNADDDGLRCLVHRRRVGFGLTNRAELQAAEVELDPLESRFSLRGVRFRLLLPGAHNIMNTLGALTALVVSGVSLESMVEPVAAFRGVDRRFQIHLNAGGRLVVDDYAHNPDKIAALMTALRRGRDAILYVFQPHGYGPTRLMKEGYIETFRRHLRPEDRLLLLPIFYAGGIVRTDISSEELARPVADSGRWAQVVPDRSLIFPFLEDYSTVVVFGARDDSLSMLASDIARRVAPTSEKA